MRYNIKVKVKGYTGTGEHLLKVNINIGMHKVAARPALYANLKLAKAHCKALQAGQNCFSSVARTFTPVAVGREMV